MAARPGLDADTGHEDLRNQSATRTLDLRKPERNPSPSTDPNPNLTPCQHLRAALCSAAVCERRPCGFPGLGKELLDLQIEGAAHRLGEERLHTGKCH